MKHYHELKEMLCRELDKFADKGEITGGTLEIIHKLTDTIKNLDKIEMLEDGGYSERGGGWEARGSYGNSGGYSGREGGSSYNDGGNSYNNGGSSYRGRRRDSMGRYSRDDGREYMTNQLREMMRNAESEPEREALRQCISKLENA